ncbi:MAG: hypothetical protein JXR63_08440 [Spirochaetales bacterium]|nr:hypothetical protein [Spirochaetales bacterium]
MKKVIFFTLLISISSLTLATANQPIYDTDEATEIASPSKFETGQPADIDPKIDYYRKGMDAGYEKDYVTAAKFLRYSFYQAKDSYRFFWYLNWLNNAKLYEAIVWEASHTDEKYLWHRAYFTTSYKFWGNALMNLARYDEAIEVFVKGYKRDPQNSKGIVENLTYRLWNSPKAGSYFMRYKGQQRLTDEIIDFYGKKLDVGSGFASKLCDWLAIRAADAILNQDKSAAKYVREFSDFTNFWINSGEKVNVADFQILTKALNFAMKNPPQKTKPYEVNIINFYIKKIEAEWRDKDGTTIKKDFGYTNEYIQNRLLDIQDNFDLAAIFYYYITNGILILNPQFKVLDAAITELEDSKFQSIIPYSVRPFPSDFIYYNYEKFDAYYWWFPHYDGIAYLGGQASPHFVPQLLTGSPTIYAKMPTAASYRVIIHEFYHGFASRLKINSGHPWLRDNEANWPQWFANGVKNNNEMLSELLWYEGYTAEYGFNDGFEKIKTKGKDPKPYEETFLLAKEYEKRLEPQRKIEADKLFVQGKAELKAGNLEAAMELLLKAHQTAPEVPLFLYELAYNLQWKAKRREDAQIYWDKYLRDFRDFQGSDVAIVYTIPWYINRDPEYALELYNLHCQNPRNNQRFSEYQMFHAKILARLKRTVEARSVVEALLDDPRCTMISEAEKFLEGLK